MNQEKRTMPAKAEILAARESIRAIWPKEVESKLDDLLAFRIMGQFRVAEEAVRLKKAVPEPKKIRTIIHLGKRKEFEEERRSAEGLPRQERVKLVMQRAEHRQAPIINSIEKVGASIVSRIWLTNSIVADLTPEQIKQLVSEREAEIERIESDKEIELELDVSAPAVKVDIARQNHNVSGDGVVVAVIDTEVDTSHSDLQGRVVRKRNYTDEAWGNPQSHGTLVAGITAGNGSESGGRYVGMAPRATIWNYKVFPTGGNGFQGAQAISDAVADGAHVINCSWGVWGTPRDGTCEWCRATDAAIDLGVVVIKSCGNRGPGSQTTTCPSNAFNIISVGALTNNGSRLTDFSSRGPTADGRPKPELVAPGENIDGCQPGGGYRSDNGTSFAAPHVGGIAALLLEKHPHLVQQDIKQALMTTAADLGYGENEQGAGRVDALAAFNYFVPGVDVYIRDNMHDKGEVPSPEPHWYSPDIWVRLNPDSVEKHQNPEHGQANYVYVRVHNRGSVKADRVDIYLYNTYFATRPSGWEEIGRITTYNLFQGQSRTIEPPFQWFPPTTGHGCLLVRLDCPQDPIRYDWNVANDNNIGQLNIRVVDNLPEGEARVTFYVTGLEGQSSLGDLEIDRTKFPYHGSIKMNVPRRYVDQGEALEGIRVEEKSVIKAIVQVTTTEIGKIRGIPLQSRERSTLYMNASLPPDVRDGDVYPIIVTQKIDGVVVGRITLRVSIVEAPPYIANRNTSCMEVHKAECRWVNKMKNYHKVPFHSLYEAFSAKVYDSDKGEWIPKYDGCAYCLPEYHTR